MNIDNFINRIVLNIKDKNIRNLVSSALKEADEQFFYAAASSSGKYHPPEDNGEHGLLRHTIKVMYIAGQLATYFDIPGDMKDAVVGAAIVHDIRKNGHRWKDKTDYRHGILGFEYIMSFRDTYSFQVTEMMLARCIRFHMYRFSKPKIEADLAVKCDDIEVKIVQLADFIASRKQASFLPGIELEANKIDDYLNGDKYVCSEL